MQVSLRGFLLIILWLSLGCADSFSAKKYEQSDLSFTPQWSLLNDSSSPSFPLFYGGPQSEVAITEWRHVDPKFLHEMKGDTVALFDTNNATPPTYLSYAEAELPQVIRVHVFKNTDEEKQLTLKLEKIEQTSNGGMIWHGQVQGTSNSMAKLSIYGGSVFGLIQAEGKVYRLSEFRDNLYRVQLLQPQNINRSGNGSGHHDSVGSGSSHFYRSGNPQANPNDAIGIRVDFAYTSLAETRAGGINALISRLNLSLSLMNLSFSNSAMSAYVFLGQLQKVEYTAGNSLSQTHDDMFSGRVANLPNDGRSIILAVGSEDPTQTAYSSRSGRFIAIEYGALGDITLPQHIGNNLGGQENESMVFSNSHGSLMSNELLIDPIITNPHVNFSGEAAGDANNFNAELMCQQIGDGCLPEDHTRESAPGYDRGNNSGGGGSSPSGGSSSSEDANEEDDGPTTQPNDGVWQTKCNCTNRKYCKVSASTGYVFECRSCSCDSGGSSSGGSSSGGSSTNGGYWQTHCNASTGKRCYMMDGEAVECRYDCPNGYK